MDRIGDDVARELRRFGTAAEMTRLVEVWPDAVGHTIARNAWPARLARDGKLHVATSSSSWAFELAQLERDVLHRLRAVAGAAAPRALRFAVGRLPELGPEPPSEAASEPLEPTAEQAELAASLAAGIADSELRKLVAKAAAASLARAASNRSFW